MTNAPTPRKVLRWFDPRSKQAGTLAFILNRVTALGLTLYLSLHLVVLGKLAQGEAAYESFTALARSPLVMVGELLVIAAGLIHGLNGIRIALNSLGVGTRHQKLYFYVVILLAVAGTAVFAARMLGE